MSGLTPLLEPIAALMEELPDQAGSVLTQLLSSETLEHGWAAMRRRLQQQFAVEAVRVQVGQFVELWRTRAPQLAPASMADLLELALALTRRQRERQQLELVWTGPESAVALCQTAQALEQVIHAAQSQLLIISYAVYDIEPVIRSIQEALERQVRVRIITESYKDGVPNHARIRAFGAQLRNRVQFFEWPIAQRPRDPLGTSQAALHVKCAIADDALLLLSSANLTRYALQLNSEMGLLITGTTIPAQARRHIDSLIQRHVFQPLV